MAGALQQMESQEGKAGLFSGLAAYTIWGLFPIYVVATKHVSALELLSHRVLWSVPFGFLILVFRKQIAETLKAITNVKTVALLALAASALALNWWVYIWAIQQEQIFQGSLGYYITPLLYVVLGVIVFKEKLSRLQGLAILFAFIGVSILTIKGGVFPAISLILAASFGLYGMLRKVIVIGAMPGLFIETIILFPVAAGLIWWLSKQGQIAWGQHGLETDILLAFAGPLTVLPLLAFAFAARRIKLSTLGILQFVGPTLQFACGLYYGESFTLAHAFCFGFIWLGVSVFAFDALKGQTHQDRAASR